MMRCDILTSLVQLWARPNRGGIRNCGVIPIKGRLLIDRSPATVEIRNAEYALCNDATSLGFGLEFLDVHVRATAA